MTRDIFYLKTGWPNSVLRRLSCSLVLSLGLINIAGAAEAVILRDGQQSYSLSRDLGYLEDKTGKVTLNDILSGASGQSFIPSQSETPNFSFTESAYWFRVELRNLDSQVTEWLLESQYPLLDHIDAYLVYSGTRVVSYNGGRTAPFSQRAIKHRNVMFKVPLGTGEHVTIYVRVNTESSMQLPLMLRSVVDLLAKDHEEQLVLGIYYGILIAMFFYNLLVFLAIRDINYRNYLLYIGGSILFQMSLNGLAFEYLWPNYPWWGKIAIPFFIGFTCVGVTQFSRYFLQLKQNLPKFDFVFRIYFWVFMFVMVGSFFMHYSTVSKIATFATLTVSVMIAIAGGICLQRRVRQAKYFMLAWSTLLLGVILYSLKTFGVLPNIFITEYGMQISSALEMVLLSFALAHRMRILREENERIQREATEMLEQRVQQRTLELDQALSSLSAANEILQDLSHIDGLTGVKNRAYFDERFDLEWRRANRAHLPLGLLMFDIDHFKSVNDTYGHLGGDDCLKRIAVAIRQAICRPGDDVFRYGGEEFAVILPNTDAAGAANIGEIVRCQVEALEIIFDDKKISITLSVGVTARIPDATNDGDSLIRNADKALYQAKRNGRNQVCVFSELTDSEASITSLP